MITALTALAAALAGALLSAPISLLPALHVYNLLGLLVVGLYALQDAGRAAPPEVYLPLMTGLIVGWSLLNTIPSILLGAPDESALFTVLPGQKYLMLGRGFEAVMMTAIGGLAGAILLVAVVGPLAPRVLPIVRSVLTPHLHWILWVIITYILMSEWPKGGNRGPAGWRKFLDAWRSLGAGLLTFALSALLGFLLLYRSPIAVESAFQNLLPAFVGLFAVPWCLFNLLSGTEPPRQYCAATVELDGSAVFRAAAAGGLGGGFAAFFPVVTGGVGGLLAGHATAQRDERVFIVSQGVSKLMYYAGAFLLFFVPGLRLRRGGAAGLLSTLFVPQTTGDYLMILGAIAVSAGVAFLLTAPLARFTLWLIARVNYRYASALALLIACALVFGVTGPIGLAVMAVAAGIGSLPILFGSRRLNCLGVLLVPMACNLSGFGPRVAGWLGLLR